MKYNQAEKARQKKLIKSAKLMKPLSWYRKNVVKKIADNKERYIKASEMTGCPPIFIALTHIMEQASDVGKFKTYIGNGQPLNKKTTIVPRNRGPFDSWEAGVKDALSVVKNLDEIKEWTIERLLYELERYNGFGYRNQSPPINTPYVWCGTNHYVKGKYTKDSKFDRRAVSRQLGCYAYQHIMLIEEMIPEFSLTKKSATEKEVPLVKIEEDPFWVKYLVNVLNFLSGLFKKSTSEVQVKAPSTRKIKDQPLLDKILKNSKGIGPKMTAMSLAWLDNPKIENKDYMLLVDFDLDETKKRMYLVDLNSGESERYKVAHGKKSDIDKDGKPDQFSNVSGSNMSSLGPMLTLKRYGKKSKGWSKFPYALQLEGLKKGLNDKIKDRAVVFHSSKYVNDIDGKNIGESLGCLAVSEKTAKKIISKINNGSLIFVYHRNLDSILA